MYFNKAAQLPSKGHTKTTLTKVVRAMSTIGRFYTINISNFIRNVNQRRIGGEKGLRFSQGSFWMS